MGLKPAEEQAARALRGNRAMRGAYLKGLQAGLEGSPIESCPYEDHRKPSGKLSWSRAFQNSWRDGWEDATTDRAQALITMQYATRRKQ